MLCEIDSHITSTYEFILFTLLLQTQHIQFTINFSLPITQFRHLHDDVTESPSTLIY